MCQLVMLPGLSTIRSSELRIQWQVAMMNKLTLPQTLTNISLPSPPFLTHLHHRPPSSLTADDFSSFLEEKVADISSQFPEPTVPTHSPFMTDPSIYLNSFSPLSEAEISDLALSHRPTSLDPVPSPLFQTISPSIITSSPCPYLLSYFRHLPLSLQIAQSYPYTQKTLP